MTTRAELIDAVVAVMVREGGLLAEWHSWRCEYPDRYGECNCNEAVAAEIVAEVLPLIADAIEADGRLDVQFLAGDTSRLGIHRMIGAEDAYQAAARLVRQLGQDDTE